MSKRIWIRRAAATSNAPGAMPKAAPARNLQVESYDNLPLRANAGAMMKVSIQAPANAKPGDVYVFHVVEKLNGRAVDGMTYVLRVRR